jgi:hypothetical protein
MVLLRNDVSEVRIASIIKVKRFCELGTTLAVTSNRSTFLRRVLQLLVNANLPCSLILVTLMSEAILSSETSVLKTATRRNMPEGGMFNQSILKFTNMLQMS